MGIYDYEQDCRHDCYAICQQPVFTAPSVFPYLSYQSLLCYVAAQTDDGNEFKAKPIGDRALKQWYRENIDSLINKKGTVKYFGFTETENPVPNLPVFKSVRIDKDIDE